MKWSDYDYPERFEDRLRQLGEGWSWSNSNGGGDWTLGADVCLAAAYDESVTVSVDVLEQPELGVFVIWADAHSVVGPGAGVLPFACSASEDRMVWVNRLGNYLVDEVRRITPEIARRAQRRPGAGGQDADGRGQS
jgi:hypothetical protein